ncbi:MAG: calcium/sodium antiporter [Verrucomicrobia bacterium]|nr:calcium/sodium antiporter [Verrucomicrobiota bacterium]
MISWFYLIAGLGLLYLGAQILVKGGAALALRLGLNALVVGLTVIAYGTSSPEMVVSVSASLQDNGAIAIGNVVGSNICNIALILGVCALVSPLSASAQIIRREIPIMIGVAVLLAAMLWDEQLSRLEGVVLFAGIVVYTVLTVREARAETKGKAEQEYGEDFPAGSMGLGKSVLLVVAGLGVLVVASQLFVGGAVVLAKSWGVTEAVIGLTVVAVGTSMPEFATSLVAAVRGHGDVAIGIVVGSNIFNVLGILGIAALINPIDTSGLSRVDLATMVVAALAMLPAARSGGVISRLEGAVLLFAYFGYTAWLVAQTI